MNYLNRAWLTMWKKTRQECGENLLSHNMMRAMTAMTYARRMFDGKGRW